MDNYTCYHLHSELSLLDSCTNYKLYIDKATELNQKAIGFSEHGSIYSWVAKKLYCKEKGIKYLHGIEIYLTKTFDEKVRDNFHTILIGRNYEGVKEINKLIELSSRPDHTYYNDRISIQEFLNLSNNVIKISACLNSPLNRIDESDPIFETLIKSYNYLEVQPHINSDDQKEYNKKLLRWSKKYNIPLIAGTDTHSLSKYKSECRSTFLTAKGREYSNEDEFDLSFKSYEELVSMFKQQGALPEAEYLRAIENTNVMSESVEDFELDTSFKYPKLCENAKEVFWERIMRMHEEKLERGIIKENPKYLQNIKEEFAVLEKIDMLSFMLCMSELICWCWENNIPCSPCRGSVGGSTIAYITDITDVDPVLRNTVFSRFANEYRLEIGDIDVDFDPKDRSKVYKYIIDRFGEEYTAFVMTNGTCVEKGTIDEIGRALKIPLNEVSAIKDTFAADPEKAKAEYPKLFYYYDGLLNTVISKGIHPAAIVISPIPLSENYGTYHHKDGDGNPIRVINLNMEELHEISLVKYDILGLKNVGVIKTCCELAGIPYPKSHEINWNDENVWADINKSNIGIFQFESSYAGDCMRKFKVKSIDDMSLVNAALRPSGASYRENLFAKKVNKNPSKIIDKMLKNNYGYLIFQEDTIKFLQDICGLTGSDADNIRRAIGRKQRDRLEKALPMILEGYCSKSDKTRDVAEQEAKAFIQIIEDSSDYQFGYNHSTGYSMLGYICAFMRYYYPIEFCTALLLNANNEEDISDGTELCKLLKIKVNPIKFRYSKADYFMDKDSNAIYKGIGSVKYLNNKVADELYELKDKLYSTFTDLLYDLKNTSVDSKQLDILIKLNFFQEFNSNTKKLLKIVENFNFFKRGDAKQISKEKVDNEALYEIIKRYSRDTNDSGKELKNFILEEIKPILYESENYINSLNINDFSLKERFQNELDYLGYISPSQKDDERRLLMVNDTYPLLRKKDGKRFGQSIITTSIGSGKKSRFTLFDRDKQEEIKKGDLIRYLNHKTDGEYFTLLEYRLV